MYFSSNMYMNTTYTYIEQHRKPEEQQYYKDRAICFGFKMGNK